MKDGIQKVREHSMAKAGAAEDEPWPGDTAWKVRGKIFAMWGGEHLTVKSTLDKQAALIQHPDISVAAYVGRFGWVTVRLADQDTLDLALELIDESYDLVTKKRKR